MQGTVVSFELQPPTPAQMAERIAAAHLWLVAVDGDDVVGYAYASPHHVRAAYRYACDVSVYLAGPARGQGLGRSLYTALFADLTRRGFTTALAGISLPNEASVGLHRAMGFEPVGTYRRVGWKFDRWHDVCWLQRFLVAGDAPPGPLT